ncbi:uncharacterized protein N7459_009737 [Penicillium hispanicum]|uniref:uncharacterized protein n=1 Tax=Penicillium hispanicum TaxID=1080232 RepID=UPI0025401A7C|nr:uncharacterized protein N7459_009737 [Penicillium hispanicum]KAJ5570307.1 hypothetical protein N7459_009737 [Penicillium hispanicum]
MNQPEYYFGNALYAPSVHPVSYSPTSFDRIAESTPSSPEAMAGSKRTFCVKKISSPRHLQCWDHGCNGRAFSTSSNLLRHQREKAGRVAKTHCPHCDAAFTRTTARNMHVVKGVCRINPLQ